MSKLPTPPPNHERCGQGKMQGKGKRVKGVCLELQINVRVK